MKRPPTLTSQLQAVENWNQTVPLGCPVKVKLDDGSVKESWTTSRAQMLGGHTAVIFLKGISGCYMLSRCTPMLAA